MKSSKQDPVVVIGAGPVGIAAAAHLLERGLRPVILERGRGVGQAMREWGHVRIFTPWKYATDRAVVELLERSGWRHPAPEELPTGREVVEYYLEPAAALPELRDAIRYQSQVIAVARRGLSKAASRERESSGYSVHYRNAAGEHEVLAASAVIDASGTWFQPNPIGIDGLPVPGEKENQDRIDYGIPDVLGGAAATYAGKKTLVIGSGHSAINVALDLLKLREAHAGTEFVWALRENNFNKLLGGGLNDELPARGALGIAAKKAVSAGALELLAAFAVESIQAAGELLRVTANAAGDRVVLEVDRIVVATGFRPDLDMLRELRLDLDQVVEAPAALAPLIDPNLHSCGTVPPHGVRELSHPDRNIFIVGMKAYGRAPTFLMLTGYEQARSIAAELAGDHEAARSVQLVLPETGVCNSDSAAGAGCCGPAKQAEPDVVTAAASGGNHRASSGTSPRVEAISGGACCG